MRCWSDLDDDQRRAVTTESTPGRGGRGRRFRQDASAHPAGRLPGRHRHRRRGPHARADVHPRGGGRAPAPPAPTRRQRADHHRHVPLGRARRAAAALARPRPAPAFAVQRPTARSIARIGAQWRRCRRCSPTRSVGRSASAARRQAHTSQPCSAASGARDRPRSRSSPKRSTPTAATSARHVIDLDDLLALTIDAFERRHRLRRRPALALPPHPGRRGAGPQPAPAPSRSISPRRTRRPLPRRRCRHSRSTASTAATRRCCSMSSDRFPGVEVVRLAGQSPVHAADRRRRLARARRSGRPPSCARRATDGPRSRSRRTPTSTRRRRADRAHDRLARSDRSSAPTRLAVLARTNAQLPEIRAGPRSAGIDVRHASSAPARRCAAPSTQVYRLGDGTPLRTWAHDALEAAEAHPVERAWD